MTFLPLVSCGFAATALVTALGHGAESTPHPTHRSTWRDAIVVEVVERYKPQFEPGPADVPPPPPPETSIFKDATRLPEDPDIVVLETITVLTDGDLKRVQAAIDNHRVRQPVNRRRWGTGIKERDFGKVRVGIVSILYVPVMFGLSW